MSGKLLRGQLHLAGRRAYGSPRGGSLGSPANIRYHHRIRRGDEARDPNTRGESMTTKIGKSALWLAATFAAALSWTGAARAQVRQAS